MHDSMIRICSRFLCAAAFATPTLASINPPINPHCFDPDLVVSDQPGVFAPHAMNNQGMLTGVLDSTADKMAVYLDGSVITVVNSFPESFGTIINEAGQAAGLGTYGILQDDRLIRTNPDGSHEILASITGSGGWAHVIGMNEAGSIVGNYSGGHGSSLWTAFVWTDKHGLEFILPEATSSYIKGIDENNRVCGYAQIDGIYQAFIWENGVVSNLHEDLGLDVTSAAWAFDGEGRILVSERPDNSFLFFWYDTTTGYRQDIHEFEFPTYSLRQASTDNGWVGFSWNNNSGSFYVARWSAESGFESMLLSDPIVGFGLSDINQDGLLVGTAFELPFYEQTAKLWADEPLLLDLNSHLETLPLGSSVTSINDRGQILMRADSYNLILNPRCKGDLDGDGATNVADLLEVISDWSTDGGGACGSDANADGTVNVSDLLIVIGMWGSCH